jgi:hypothetical protein
MDIVEFLTSKEIIVVYIVAAVACLLCFIIYLVEKHNDRGRKRHNTKELNKLVEQIKEEVEILPEEEITEPVLQMIEEVSLPVQEEVKEVEEVEEVEEESISSEDIKKVIEEISTEVRQELNANNEEEIEVLEPDEELEYTTIEPDASVAKEELNKITEELKEQEEKIEEVVENALLTDYEVEQESTAIISLEELVKKSKELYENNELTQYNDEGNEPISISELEVVSGRKAEPITSPFEISTVVGDEPIDTVSNEFETIKANIEPEVKRFKSSPIISPIYGIEKQEVSNDLELENTANYEKLDAEIKKTNEFLMTLKELQSKLD